MKVTLKFDQDDIGGDKQELKRVLKARSLTIAIDEIWEKIFRPVNKHGYSDKDLRELMNLNGNEQNLIKIIDKLGEIYIEILKDNKLDMDDLLY